jgi:alpha/beta superfamily hydrolase
MTGAESFGWFHEPVNSTRSKMGLVLCSSFGNENDATYRSLRNLASAAAEKGIATLRFDYYGSGDSAGADTENDHPSAWLSGIHAAIDALRKQDNIEKICILGIRLGALLAAVVANERTDICGYIALAPIPSGRAFLREALLRNEQETRGEEFDLELAGYVLTPLAQNEFKSLDLLSMTCAPAKNVLIIAPDTRRATQQWIAQLSAQGSHVEIDTQCDLKPVIERGGHKNIPHSLIERVTTWVGNCAVNVGYLPSRALVTETKNVLHLNGVCETPITLWADSIPLFAILSEPERQPVHNICVFLNAGAGRRTGPRRLYVNCARAWAQQGTAVLRLDMPGIGDSEDPPNYAEGEVYTINSTQAIATAVQYMRSRFGDNVYCHLIGLCSGAYHALKAAIAGTPIQSVVLINQLAYFRPAEIKMGDPRLIWELAYYLSVLGRQSEATAGYSRTNLILRRGKWKLIHCWFWLRNALRNALRPLAIAIPNDLEGELHALARSNIMINMLFSGQDAASQLLYLEGGRTVTTLQRQGKIKIRTIQDANHAFTSNEAQVSVRAELESIVHEAAASTVRGS